MAGIRVKASNSAIAIFFTRSSHRTSLSNPQGVGCFWMTAQVPDAAEMSVAAARSLRAHCDPHSCPLYLPLIFSAMYCREPARGSRRLVRRQHGVRRQLHGQYGDPGEPRHGHPDHDNRGGRAPNLCCANISGHSWVGGVGLLGAAISKQEGSKSSGKKSARGLASGPLLLFVGDGSSLTIDPALK